MTSLCANCCMLDRLLTVQGRQKTFSGSDAPSREKLASARNIAHAELLFYSNTTRAVVPFLNSTRATATGTESIERALSIRSAYRCRAVIESIGRVIGASDRRHKKYELDSADAYLYRLRFREKTVD